MSKAWGFIKDPIHGYVRISEAEKTIIDTRPVQRLRRLRQLAGSEFVYPAANHTRFEHVVGAMHLAGVLAVVLPTRRDVHMQEQARLAALLHDIGHGPFSHVFEPLMVRHLKKTHEDFVPWLVKETEIAVKLDKAGFDPRKLGLLAVGRLRDGKRRSEERRVGKECRSRGSPDHEKKKISKKKTRRCNNKMHTT